MIELRSRGASIAMIATMSLVLGSCQMFGGSPGDPMQELREQVTQTVTDTERQIRMLDSIDRMDALLGELADQVATVIKRKRELFADYDSTREEF